MTSESVVRKEDVLVREEWLVKVTERVFANQEIVRQIR